MKIVLLFDLGERWSYNFQDEGSNIMIGIRDLHEHILYYIIGIIIFVSYWLIKEILRKKGISKYFTSHSLLEIIWTITPGFILLSIGIPSLKLLYISDEIYKPSLTLKIKGSQWYWNYEIYQDFAIDSYSKTNEFEYGEIRLLDVDNILVLPINTMIRLLVTSDDVIHSFAIPSLGVKIDAIPGRLNQSNIYILRESLFYGQCSELCGINHNNMSIVLKSVTYKEYINYLISNSNISLNNLLLIQSTFTRGLKY